MTGDETGPGGPDEADEEDANGDPRTPAGNGVDGGPGEPDGAVEGTMRRAIAEVRGEGRKAAVIHAVVDAAVAALATNLAVTVVDVPLLGRAIPLPGILSRGVAAVGVAPPVAVEARVLLVLCVGVLALSAGLAYRLREPLVERFESANPEVSEALRTARDALEAGDEGRVARALYADVIERLASTSSLGLVSVRRLAASVALVVVLSALTVQVSVAGIGVDLDGGPGDGGAGGPTGPGAVTTPRPTSGELLDGDEVLGEPENVTAGSENLSAVVEAGSGGEPGDDRARSYDRSGLSSDPSAVEPQRAGFAEREVLEDAELIKEYNLRIREDENSG